MHIDAVQAQWIFWVSRHKPMIDTRQWAFSGPGIQQKGCWKGWGKVLRVWGEEVH